MQKHISFRNMLIFLTSSFLFFFNISPYITKEMSNLKSLTEYINIPSISQIGTVFFPK